MSNLGQLVKWQDGIGEQGGGWHTGRLVTKPSGEGPVRYFTENPGYRKDSATNTDEQFHSNYLVQESCCGTLTWVESSRLSKYLDRKERGEE